MITQKLKTGKEDTAYWLIEENTSNNWKLIVEIRCVDIYSAGYVYDIIAYCPDAKIKMMYQRVKSYRSLLTDETAVCDYFSNGGELCANMADFGYCRKNMTKKDFKMISDMTIAEKRR